MDSTVDAPVSRILAAENDGRVCLAYRMMEEFEGVSDNAVTLTMPPLRVRPQQLPTQVLKIVQLEDVQTNPGFTAEDNQRTTQRTTILVQVLDEDLPAGPARIP